MEDQAPVELAPIDGSFAHEIVGVDLWNPLDAEARATLDEALARHGVLVFRRQALSDTELAALASHFGSLERVVRTDWASTECPEIIRLSNLRDWHGEPIGGLGSGELNWHTDQSYMSAPCTGAMLHLVEGADAAHTYWANLKLAYRALPEGLRRKLEPLRGVFSYAKRQASYRDDGPLDEAIRKKTPDVTHPLVHEDPATAERALYLDPATTVGIEGLARSEAEALLEEINTHATEARFVYRHTWQTGDVVMWDNGFLLHRRDAFDAGSPRLVKRATFALSAERHIVPGGG